MSFPFQVHRRFVRECRWAVRPKPARDRDVERKQGETHCHPDAGMENLGTPVMSMIQTQASGRVVDCEPAWRSSVVVPELHREPGCSQSLGRGKPNKIGFLERSGEDGKDRNSALTVPRPGGRQQRKDLHFFYPSPPSSLLLLSGQMSSSLPINQGPDLTAPTPQNTPLQHAPITAGLSRPTVPDITESDEPEEDGPDTTNLKGALAGLVHGRLAGLLGKSSGYVENLPTPVKRSLEGLKGLQVKQTALQNQYKMECLELEKKVCPCDYRFFFLITLFFFAFPLLFGSINTPAPFASATPFRFLVAYRNPALFSGGGPK